MAVLGKDRRYSGPVLGTLVLKDEIKGHMASRWPSRQKALGDPWGPEFDLQDLHGSRNKPASTVCPLSPTGVTP